MFSRVVTYWKASNRKIIWIYVVKSIRAVPRKSFKECKINVTALYDTWRERQREYREFERKKNQFWPRLWRKGWGQFSPKLYSKLPTTPFTLPGSTKEHGSLPQKLSTPFRHQFLPIPKVSAATSLYNLFSTCETIEHFVPRRREIPEGFHSHHPWALVFHNQQNIRRENKTICTVYNRQHKFHWLNQSLY